MHSSKRSVLTFRALAISKMMLRYGTLSWKLLHEIMGSGVGGCVNVPALGRVEGNRVPDPAISGLVF